MCSCIMETNVFFNGRQRSQRNKTKLGRFTLVTHPRRTRTEKNDRMYPTTGSFMSFFDDLCIVVVGYVDLNELEPILMALIAP